MPSPAASTALSFPGRISSYCFGSSGVSVDEEEAARISGFGAVPSLAFSGPGSAIVARSYMGIDDAQRICMAEGNEWTGERAVGFKDDKESASSRSKETPEIIN
jgi:hypothetical protein